MRLKKILAAGLATLMLTACAVPAVSALKPHGTGIKMRNWLTNDPNYEFSDAYKTSVWYDNFTSLDFSENQRNTVLRIAVSQLGYHEGDSAADFNGMNMSGSSNYIEYARLLVPHYNDNHYEWCACFVNWCLNQAHIDYVSSEIGCWKWVGELKGMKYWQDSSAYGGTYTPKPADMIFFNWKHAESKNNASGHIGYVLYTTETHVYTIEGNADNNVTIRSYALNDPSVIGYGTPPYDEGNEETIDFSYKNGRPRGYYVVNNMNARLKDEGGKSICRVPVGSCVELCGVADGQAKVLFDDKEGYLPENILVLMTPMTGKDTLTFDANGGQNAPASAEIAIGESTTVTMDTPTLEGDTFLGWALRPYDMIPDYLPGDTISLTGSMTLYAIWENHSLTLAKAALADGIYPRLRRPDATNNSAAVVLGSVNPALLVPQNGTYVTLADDTVCGKVLSVSSTEICSDPYFTIPYAELMKSAELPIRDASDVTFVVFRIKNVSLSNRAMDLFYTCDTKNTSDESDQTARIVSSMADKTEDWQYLVFDMREAKDWDGNILSLRLDYERSSMAADETLLVSDLFLLSKDAELAALKDGTYFFAADDKVSYEDSEETTSAPQESETLPESVSDPESATSSLITPEASDTADASVAETATPDASATQTETSADTAAASGCSAVASSALAVLTVLGAALLIKRRED